MEATQASLVIVGANTADCRVYFNGVQVDGVKSISVSNDSDTHRVTLRINETPQVAELKAAGIMVRREA